MQQGNEMDEKQRGKCARYLISISSHKKLANFFTGLITKNFIWS
jgi:hypothetical protein